MSWYTQWIKGFILNVGICKYRCWHPLKLWHLHLCWHMHLVNVITWQCGNYLAWCATQCPLLWLSSACGASFGDSPICLILGIYCCIHFLLRFVFGDKAFLDCFRLWVIWSVRRLLLVPAASSSNFLLVSVSLRNSLHCTDMEHGLLTQIAHPIMTWTVSWVSLWVCCASWLYQWAVQRTLQSYANLFAGSTRAPTREVHASHLEDCLCLMSTKGLDWQQPQ